MRSPFKNSFALLLGDAAQHSELLALGLQLLIVVEAMKNLLFGFVANGAGVVEDQVGLFHGFNLTVTLADESADHLFRIVYVHLTPEGLDVKGLTPARVL